MIKHRIEAHHKGYQTTKGPIPARDVVFEIEIDPERLIAQIGGRALGKSRKTTLADGAIVVRAISIKEE
jgi:hypothetical protein